MKAFCIHKSTNQTMHAAATADFFSWVIILCKCQDKGDEIFVGRDYDRTEKQNMLKLINSESINWSSQETFQTLHAVRIPCTPFVTSLAPSCNWRQSPLQLRAMGKQLKKYFVAGLQPKGINYNSLLGTDPATRSVGSGSELCLGATSCKQTVRGWVLLSWAW